MTWRFALLGCALALVLLPVSSVAGAEPAARWAGRPLVEVLAELEGRGLRLIYTSRLVPADLRVLVEPVATDPRRLLEELLAPHGLEARGEGLGPLVIVPRVLPFSRLEGQVIERDSREPLGGVRVLLPELGRATLSGADGFFVVAEVPAGEIRVVAQGPGFVQVAPLVVAVGEGDVAEVTVEMAVALLALDEIVVTPSAVTMITGDPAPPLTLEIDELIALPNVTDDLFRSLARLPGISGSEVSAELHVRGGRADEVLVIFDQLELFEPYHLRDFNNALTLVAPRAVAEVDLILGGFPAIFGDRMGGVLEMRSAKGDQPRHFLSASPIALQVGSSAPLADGGGDFFALGRLGSFELLSDFLAPEERPSYWDAFAKVDRPIGDRQRWGARWLQGEDRLRFLLTEDGDREEATTFYGNSYGWLLHQAVLGSRVVVDSVMSRGEVRRGRRAEEAEGREEGFTLRDERRLRVLGLKQAWQAESRDDRHYLRAGFDLRRLDADYDYFNDRVLEDPLAAIRSEPRTGTTSFRRRIRGEQYGLYVTERLRLGGGQTVEVGLRYDEQTIAGDRDFSPRLNWVAALGERSTLRAAWGHYFQSQRPYELRVEDGETTFLPAERTEQYALGFERILPRGASLRVDAYRRQIADPRPRFENVFEPVSSFPEIEPDRVRLAPDRTEARGVEVFLRGSRGPRWQGWASYAYARIRDQGAGGERPRAIDQPHTLNLESSFIFGKSWTVAASFHFHSGWPTTAIGGRLEEDDEGELEPVAVFGPLFAERLPDFHRLDLHLRRQWPAKRGTVTLSVDLQNVYNRKNLAGYDVDFDFVVRPDGTVEPQVLALTWAGFVPSFGVDWSF